MLNYTFDLRRMLCEATVERALRDIQREAKRSLRNLVDLGMNFSHGRFSSHFFGMVQTMLTDEQSAYFEAAQDLTQRVNTDTIKTFGINVGLEGCTRGARRIREQESREGCNVPWALTICAGDRGVRIADCLRLVEEGSALGICVYVLLDCGLTGDDIQLLASSYPKCAFCLFSDSFCASLRELTQLQDLHNVMFFVDGDSSARSDSMRNLKTGRFLYGMYRWYDDDSFDAVTCEKALDSYREDGPAIVCLLPRSGTTPATCRLVNQRATSQRISQLYPYCIMELCGDLLAVDTVISGDECSVSVCPDGQVYTHQSGRLEGADFSIHSASLLQLLHRAVPKAPAQEGGASHG